MRKYFAPVNLQDAHVHCNDFVVCGHCQNPMALKSTATEVRAPCEWQSMFVHVFLC